jgi:hypothetical protein
MDNLLSMGRFIQLQKILVQDFLYGLEGALPARVQNFYPVAYRNFIALFHGGQPAPRVVGPHHSQEILPGTRVAVEIMVCRAD